MSGAPACSKLAAGRAAPHRVAGFPVVGRCYEPARGNDVTPCVHRGAGIARESGCCCKRQAGGHSCRLAGGLDLARSLLRVASPSSPVPWEERASSEQHIAPVQQALRAGSNGAAAAAAQQRHGCAAVLGWRCVTGWAGEAQITACMDAERRRGCWAAGGRSFRRGWGLGLLRAPCDRLKPLPSHRIDRGAPSSPPWSRHQQALVCMKTALHSRSPRPAPAEHCHIRQQRRTQAAGSWSGCSGGFHTRCAQRPGTRAIGE